MNTTNLITREGGARVHMAAGCTGNCADTCACDCSHAAVPRSPAPRIPRQPVPITFVGHARRPSLWRRLWARIVGR